MKLTEPIGNTVYAPLFVRISLGSYFVMTGLAKVQDLGGFVAQVQEFHLLPAQFATVYGILVPYIEIIAGGMVLLGMWTTLGAFLLALIIGSFVYAFGIFPKTNLVFNKDLILLACALSVMYSGSGAFSVDRFRKTG